MCCHVHGFHPYFYVAAPPNFSKEQLPEFRSCLNAALLNDMRSNKEHLDELVLSVELHNKSTIYGFQVSTKGIS